MHASLAIWIMQGFNGLSNFSVLLLMALGLAIIFGQMGVINMAHGEFLTIGAYTTYLLSHLSERWVPWLAQSYFLLAIIVAFAVAGVVGLAVEYFMVRHLYRRPLDTLLATWGLSLIMQQTFRSVFGAREVSATLPGWLMGSVKPTPTIDIPINGLVVMGLTTVLTALVFVGLFRTRTGDERARHHAESLHGERRGHQHRTCRSVHVRNWLRPRRDRGGRVHDHRLNRADERLALHRRHVPRRRLRGRTKSPRHDWLRVCHRSDPGHN
jgi:hypothetical protein